MAFGRRSSRVEAHQKSMGSYQMHAWRDAMAIASLLDETVGIEKARKIYEALPLEKVIKYEQSVAEGIADFIQKPESQRPAFLRKLPQGIETRVGFLTLAIIGCVSAKDTLELRDAFRNTLAAGGGNRITVSNIYMFAQEVRGLFTYEWPWEIIDAMGLDDGGDDGLDEDGEED
jgi:hypothetical protein